ncbi:MAG: hypothetical protein GY911_00170, partial [Actinomycetales bacterium]|nr:hypothetical protein [Actinomycetales bacterium]
TALITASYDGADAVEVLRWESSAESEFYKSDDSAHWNETVTVALNNPEGAQKLTLTIGYLTAGNDWWWAIDNVVVYSTAPVELALPANHYFVEDFNSLELGPNVDEGVANATAWTDTPPTGWTVDDSGVPGVGDPATDGVTEWAGWSFANAEWWITTAGDQNRSKFTKATGNAAVADGDEWDDAAHAEGKMSALMSTPEISIA